MVQVALHLSDALKIRCYRQGDSLFEQRYGLHLSDAL